MFTVSFNQCVAAEGHFLQNTSENTDAVSRWNWNISCTAAALPQYSCSLESRFCATFLSSILSIHFCAPNRLKAEIVCLFIIACPSLNYCAAFSFPFIVELSPLLLLLSQYCLFCLNHSKMICQVEGCLFAILIMNEQFPAGVARMGPEFPAGIWMHIYVDENKCVAGYKFHRPQYTIKVYTFNRTTKWWSGWRTESSVTFFFFFKFRWYV